MNIDEQVTARLAPVSIGTLAAGGNVTITATHTATFTSKGEATAAGDNAVGADLAMNVVLGWSTTAAIDRNVSGDAVSITADSTMTSTAESQASAKGSSDSDDSSDDKSDKQVNDNANTAGKTGGGVPSSNDSASTGNSNASSQSGSSGGSVGIAAAIAVNWVVTDNVARIGNNAHVIGGTGLVKVSAKNQNDSSAKAYGLASNLDNSNNIAAAVGLNVVDVSNTASIGDDAHVEGVGITVEAITPAGEQNDFIVWGLAGAGGKSDFSVSASVGIQVINYETTAKVQKGADLESTGGITVHATAFLGLQSLALAGGVSIGGTAVGASLIVNIIEDFATAAFIDSGTGLGSITHADATGAIQVKAEAHLHPLVPDPDVTKITFPALTSVAVAGGAGTGDLSVSGSILIDVWDLSTKAYIADGAQVNQTTAGGVGPDDRGLGDRRHRGRQRRRCARAQLERCRSRHRAHRLGREQGRPRLHRQVGRRQRRRRRHDPRDLDRGLGRDRGQRRGICEQRRGHRLDHRDRRQRRQRPARRQRLRRRSGRPGLERPLRRRTSTCRRATPWTCSCSRAAWRSGSSAGIGISAAVLVAHRPGEGLGRPRRGHRGEGRDRPRSSRRPSRPT